MKERQLTESEQMKRNDWTIITFFVIVGVPLLTYFTSPDFAALVNKLAGVR